MANIGVKGSIKVCTIRATRLDANTCAFAYAPGGDPSDVSSYPGGGTDVAITDAIVSLTSSAEYEAGQEYIGKNGCGVIQISVKESDSLKRVNLQANFITRDLEFLELVSGADLFTGVGAASASTVGMTRRAVGAAEPDPVSLEVWTRAADQSGECAGATSASWWRWVWPKTKFTLGDVNLDNNVGEIQVTGFSEPNPNWDLGPNDDWPASDVTRAGSSMTPGVTTNAPLTAGGLPQDVAEAVIFETEGLPAEVVTVQTNGGYVTS